MSYPPLQGEGRSPQRSEGERGGVLCGAASPPPGALRAPTSPLQGEVDKASVLTAFAVIVRCL